MRYLQKKIMTRIILKLIFKHQKQMNNKLCIKTKYKKIIKITKIKIKI